MTQEARAVPGVILSEIVQADPLKVLIVDDHPMVREGLAGIFARYNISVTGLAANGQAAIEMFRQERPDVVLLDLRLPDRSGMDVLRALLAIDPLTRVVILTSAQGDASVHEAISLRSLRLSAQGHRRWSPRRATSPRSRRRQSALARDHRKTRALRRLAFAQ